MDRFQFIQKLGIPFFIFWITGFASAFLDFDHIREIIQNKLPLTWETLGGREYHILFFLLFGYVWLFSFTYVYRLHALVLREVNDNDSIS